MNNKVLTIVLIVLLALFFGNKIFKGKKTVSFDKTFSAIDTEKIDKVFVSLKGNSTTYELRKEGNKWFGLQNNQNYLLNEDRVNSFLAAISDIQIKRLVAKSKEKWEQFEVGEESGNRIKVLKGDNTLLDLIVGRFSFDQQTRSATSYLRKKDEDEVFAMDGFASMTLNQDFNGLRYNKVVDLEENQIAIINLNENDQSLTLKKENEKWFDFIGNTIDSTAVTSFLNGITNLTSNNFAENRTGDNIASITFHTLNGEINTMQILQDTSGFVINSPVEDIYFRSDSSGIFKKLVLDFKDLFQ